MGYLLPNNPNNATLRKQLSKKLWGKVQIFANKAVVICDYLRIIWRLFALFVDYLRIICKIICELFELFADYLHYLLADIVWGRTQFWAPNEVPPQKSNWVILPLSVGHFRLIGIQTAWRSLRWGMSAVNIVCMGRAKFGIIRIACVIDKLCRGLALTV